MRTILASPPELDWEVSRLLPKSGYLHFPGLKGGPGFYLTRRGFHYHDPENFALSYERTPEGFSLLEVKKRTATTELARCPIFFPIQNCVERHHLMLATVLHCTTSCSYRFVVFDSTNPYPILLSEPVIPGLMKRLLDGWRPAPDMDVQYEESGVVFDTDDVWADFISERFAFIGREVREARKPPGFRLLRPLGW